MNIKDFVSTSLSQICEGIVEAQDKTKAFGACIAPRMRSDGSAIESHVMHSYVSHVNFDLAIEVDYTSNEHANGVKGEIKIADLASLSFGKDSKNSETNVKKDISRLSFNIPVCWPLSALEDKGYQKPYTDAKF